MSEYIVILNKDAVAPFFKGSSEGPFGVLKDALAESGLSLRNAGCGGPLAQFFNVVARGGALDDARAAALIERLNQDDMRPIVQAAYIKPDAACP